MLRRIKTYISVFVAVLSVFVTSSCNIEELEPEIPSITEITLTAFISNDSTSVNIGTDEEVINSEDYNIVWRSNDAIGVINNGRLYRFVITGDGINTSKGIFSLDISSLPPDYVQGDFNTDMPLQVFYPYDGLAYDSYSKNLYYTVPSKQTNLECVCLPMAAYSDNAKDSIYLKKLSGVFSFSISGPENEYVNSIEVLSSTKINGKAIITIKKEYENIPEISMSIFQHNAESDDTTDNRRTSLECFKSGESLANLPDFLVLIPENTKDLGIMINTSATSYYKSINLSSEIKAGKILSIPKFDTRELPYAYIENGVYYGDGVSLPKSEDGVETLIWAPVNCGFENTVTDRGILVYQGYPYGKLYQWGRKDGQGYYDFIYQDASYPYEISSIGTNKPEADNFYLDWSLLSKDWPSDSDPCPPGWRIPSFEELLSLVKGLEQDDFLYGLESQWTYYNDDTNDKHYGLPGFWFYGNTDEKNDKVFFPAGGFHNNILQGYQIRGLSGCYWSSTSNVAGSARYMDFNRKGYIETYYNKHAQGRSIRCVKSIN